MAKKRDSVLIIIILVVIIAGILIIAFKPSVKNSCSSPYSKIGEFCCLDDNKNNLCDDNEQKFPLAVSSDNLDGALSWVSFETEAASSSGNIPKNCDNGKNEGDIWLDFVMKNVPYNISYTCETELVQGEQTDLWSGSNKGQWSNSIHGKVAYSQYLTTEHSVQVCCYPPGVATQDVCKLFNLEPYC